MFDMRFQDTRRRARTVSLRSGYPVDRTMRPQEAVWDSGERCSRVAAQRPGPEGDPADNPFWDEDDFSACERMPLPPRWLRQREEDPDTVAEMRRDSGDEAQQPGGRDEDLRQREEGKERGRNEEN